MVTLSSTSESSGNADTPENSELPSNSIRDVIVDKENNIWLAMSEIINNGCIIKISGEAWTIYDTEDLGIMPYYFGNLAVDTNNNIYASIDYTLSSLWDMTRPNIIKFDGYCLVGQETAAASGDGGVRFAACGADDEGGDGYVEVGLFGIGTVIHF